MSFLEVRGQTRAVTLVYVSICQVRQRWQVYKTYGLASWARGSPALTDKLLVIALGGFHMQVGTIIQTDVNLQQ